MHLRQQRVSDNERVVRRLPPDEPFEIRCECGEESCVEHVVVTRDVYDGVRARDGAVFVRPGHERLGRVVETHERYLVVEAS